MAKLKTNQEGGVAVPERKPRAMPAIVRNVPPGHCWGWYTREDPRIHLHTLEDEHKYKVWLESKGKRIIEPAGKIPAKVLKALGGAVQENRQKIEDRWVRLMLDKDWIALHVALPNITLVAYPNTPSKFTRVIDLSTWLNPKLLAELNPNIIDLNWEMAALRLFTNRPNEDTYDVRLSRLLWTD